MEHARFVRTGAVKGFYNATKSTDPLWLVEFDKEENENEQTLYLCCICLGDRTYMEKPI